MTFFKIKGSLQLKRGGTALMAHEKTNAMRILDAKKIDLSNDDV